MKITVISDTHGSLLGWEAAQFIVSKSEAVIHCGDIFNHGPGNPLPEKYSPKSLLDIFNSFDKPLLVAKGNCDSEVDEKLLDIPVSYPYVICQVDNTRILATHGHLFSEEQLLSISRKWKVDILLTGHTHKWKIEKHGHLLWINPGSPSIPKEAASSAFIDTGNATAQVFNLITKQVIGETSFP